MELNKETQKAIIESELQEWMILRYRLQVRYRVAEKLGDPQERLDAIRKELERVEQGIDALGEELKQL